MTLIFGFLFLHLDSFSSSIFMFEISRVSVLDKTLTMLFIALKCANVVMTIGRAALIALGSCNCIESSVALADFRFIRWKGKRINFGHCPMNLRLKGRNKRV